MYELQKADPQIALITQLLKLGGISQEALDILCKLHFVTSNKTTLDVLGNKLLHNYEDQITTLKACRESNDHFYIIMTDNQNIIDFSSESRQKKVNTIPIESMSNLYLQIPKNKEFILKSSDPNRAPLMPRLDDDKHIQRVYKYVMSNGDVDIEKLFRKCAVPCKYDASLTHFHTLGNLPFRSSLLTSHIQGIQELLIEGIFRQQGKEVILPVDPEFSLQSIRLVSNLYEKFKMNFYAIPIFHFMKHSIESCQKSMLFQFMFMIPIINGMGTHVAKYGDMQSISEEYVFRKNKEQGISVETHLNMVLDKIQCIITSGAMKSDNDTISGAEAGGDTENSADNEGTGMESDNMTEHEASGDTQDNVDDEGTGNFCFTVTNCFIII
jgi:hypothetical protein